MLFITQDIEALAKIFGYKRQKFNGCIEMKLGLTEKGYARTTRKGKSVKVHREVYKLIHQVELTKDQFVCHHCDNPPCINPEHLFLGDARINMQDKVNKGRARKLFTMDYKRRARKNTKRKANAPLIKPKLKNQATQPLVQL